MSDTLSSVRCHIRWMIRRDMPEIVRIDAASFESPWAEEDFLTCLRARNCIGMVAEWRGRPVGHMVYELHKTHIVILNLAVDPAVRGRGVGSQMLDKLKGKLKGKLEGHRRTRITLSVRETNLAAQKFFRSEEFLATRVLPRHYEDSGEDAYLMAYWIEPNLEG